MMMMIPIYGESITHQDWPPSGVMAMVCQSIKKFAKVQKSQNKKNPVGFTKLSKDDFFGAKFRNVTHCLMRAMGNAAIFVDATARSLAAVGPLTQNTFVGTHAHFLLVTNKIFRIGKNLEPHRVTW